MKSTACDSVSVSPLCGLALAGVQTFENSSAVEAMRKSLSPSPSDSLTPARVFGVPLDEVQQSGQPGQEVPLLVRHIVEYVEEHGEWNIHKLYF